MIRGLFKNPFTRFLILSTTLYLIWYFLYEFYLKENTFINEYVIDSLVKLGESVLHGLGYETTPYTDGKFRQHFGVLGTAGVTIGAPCDGIVLFALFVVFMISYPGPVKHKAWFLPVGLAMIHGLNVLRVTALALIVYHNESWFSFNHDYTFTLIVYAAVFALWWLWIVKFSLRKSKLAS
ncbi:MAG: exosortase X [Flavobacteriales bacterium]|jgi:exosortase family protein XrtF